MRRLLCVVLVMGMFAIAGCATTDFDYFQTESKPFTPYQEELQAFGGFEGSCSSLVNFALYWECMSENSGGGNDGGDSGAGGE